MDRRLVLTIIALCVVNVDSNGTTDMTQGSSTATQSYTLKSTPCTCNPAPCTIPPQTQSPPPILGVLKAEGKKCDGDIYLTLLNSSQSLPVCINIIKFEWPLWSGWCERNGCQGKVRLTNGPQKLKSFNIAASGEITNETCKTLAFNCDVIPDTSGELVRYKVVTAILCVLVLVLLMVRFGHPSLKAFRKKMSDRRQSRWIGPTQSQSVSYHRGKAGLQVNDNTDKRSSFPGLERLTVNNSREPSSNRNSDYDSYNV
ncbi:hypothetical protein UPYG_G00043460 [Umbra pygmaea]|uniref:Uncharacterized protein n=1 Tax=Umbra pygmaea TaxID=75934 RepID=A0ABD0XQI6_UMBPY